MNLLLIILMPWRPCPDKEYKELEALGALTGALWFGLVLMGGGAVDGHGIQAKIAIAGGIMALLWITAFVWMIIGGLLGEGVMAVTQRIRSGSWR